MRLLSKEDQVMARPATCRKPFRKRDMDGSLAAIPHRSHPRQGASNGDMLKLAAAVLSSQNVGSVRIIR